MTKTIVFITTALVLGFVLGVVGLKSYEGQSFGGLSYDVLHQGGDIYQGISDSLIFRNGALALTTTNTSTIAQNLRFTASSTGGYIVFPASNGSGCFALTLNKAGNVATSSVSCN